MSACGGGSGSSCQSCNNAPVSTAPITTLSGKIADSTGQAVSGVTVSLYHHNDHTTDTATTDANGQFSFAGVDATSNSQYTADYVLYAEKAGYAFYPAPANSTGVVSRFDFNGLYRTVIRFAPPAASSATGNHFTAYRASDKRVSLARSGQTISYAAGDDAAAATGVAWPSTRWMDNRDGTLSDRLTGLTWLKNANCFGGQTWSEALSSANQLAQGSCGLTDASTAGQWRMPNANELESLVDVSQNNPALPSGADFANVNLAAAYWSSTTYTALPSSAMAIRLSDGRWINAVDANDGGFSNVKASSKNILLAVKSGSPGVVQLLATGVYAAGAGNLQNNGGTPASQGDDASLRQGVALNSPRFIDQGNGTVVDSMTGLTWLKKADCITDTWANALARIRQLGNGQCGLSDGSSAGQWRLPNRNEMLSLSDRAPTFPQAEYLTGQAQGSNGPVTGPVTFAGFVAFKYYWTSTSYAADPVQAWAIFSCDFGVYNLPKTDAVQLALAVR